MPGNEIEIIKYLVNNKGEISLSHLGIVTSVGAPNKGIAGFREIPSADDVDEYLSIDDSHKKADIYINGQGVSLKEPACNLFNRLQRAEILDVFTQLRFENPANILQLLDREVTRFHEGSLDNRNRLWQDFFNEEEFKSLARFLMTQGSPNVGFSLHPADFILETPSRNISGDKVEVFTFEEYFETYKSKIKIAIRRVWFGQTSESEHDRAVSLMKKIGNASWVFNNVSGTPKVHRSGRRWRQNIPSRDRKTVYFLMVEKVS